MATLVTGGTGFIGCVLVKELAEKGNQVVSLDIIPPDDLLRRYVEPWAEQVTWIEGDILDKETLDKVAAFGNIDKIIHSAAYTPFEKEMDDFQRVVDINVMGTVKILGLARRLGVKRFMYVSSGAVYPGGYQSDLPCREDMPLKPFTAFGVYGNTKYCSEGITQRYGELCGFETVSARLSQNWGPMERVTPYHTHMSIPYDWVNKAVRGKPIELSLVGADIAELRQLNVDHIYAKDMAVAIISLMDAPILSHLVYNISGGYPLTLNGLVSAMREVFPSVKFIEPTSKVDISKAPRRSMDPNRLREDVGFIAQYDLVSALRDYKKWLEDFNFTG